MISKRFSNDYSIEKNFPDAKCIRAWEGGGADHAIKDGIHYLIIDERTMQDFLDENHPVDKEVINNLLHIIQFEDEEEFQSYLEKELSWAVNLENR